MNCLAVHRREAAHSISDTHECLLVTDHIVYIMPQEDQGVYFNHG